MNALKYPNQSIVTISHSVRYDQARMQSSQILFVTVAVFEGLNAISMVSQMDQSPITF